MTRRSVVFAAPGRIEVANDDIPSPGDGEVLVRTLVSGISAGSELHVYRGDISEGVLLDESLSALREPFGYPTTYGYASVGERVDDGRRVFAFHPHASHHLAREDELHELPAELSFEAAALWPSAETAVNVVLDARLLVGERVLVVGQGIVGLMTTSLLARFPLAELSTVDPIESRRVASERRGAGRSVHPDEASELEVFDLTVELSGTSAGLDVAIAATGFEGRVVVGSWYGDKPVPVDLGTHFHRGRLRLISSQVSHIGSALRSLWTKERRIQVAAASLSNALATDLITHRFPVERAAEAYALVDEHPERCLQVLLTYT
ncbi:MAG: zinc-binding alcohol dehydrogenase [Acidobacteriota bacterium]|nr:MAG: zinc-binding alcohol dehydrogenase [Acidobacteriota bacterium]